MMTTALIVASLLSMALAFVRLLKGPTHADRVVALDVVLAATLGLAAAAARFTGQALFLDAAIGLALVGFVATIAWARLIDAQGAKEPS